jgi:para-aminobenzoate synthetase component I
MKPFVFELPQMDPLRAYLAIKHIPYSLLLDSADMSHQNNRYSFVMSHPIETIEAKGNKISITNWDQKLSLTGDPFVMLNARMKSWINRTEHVHGLPPFQGGAAGLFGYDLGRSLENIPNIAADADNIPDMAVGIYDQVLAYDHLLHKGWIFTHAPDEAAAQQKREFFLELISREYDIPKFKAVHLDWESNFDAHEYMENIETVQEYILAGDIFQANISQRFDASLPEGFDPFIHYMHMRRVNPAPFSSFMNLGSVKISSASPERFLTVRGGEVETCPIKGTRPHVHDIMMDRAYKNELKNSEKDRAENTMIVDLLRNDLAKCCEPASITVTDLCKLETFAHVHHLVSTIKGKLHKDKTAIDLLRGCFPGGSITGAPKIRAMEIIEEIEPTRRGPYCGAIGYIGFDGNMDTNILIRTLIYNNNSVSLQVGGGIVMDSDPNAEYQETFDKASAILHSFEHDSDSMHAGFAEAV